jgi:hypothetical protein
MVLWSWTKAPPGKKEPERSFVVWAGRGFPL